METTEAKEIRKYELMVIYSGDMPEASFEKELSELKKALKENSKSITHEDNWGLRNLAFRIKKQSRGYYVVFNFEADPSQIMELRSVIRLTPPILRHMLITVPDSYVPGHHEDPVIFRDEKKAEEAAARGKKHPKEVASTMPEKAKAAPATAKEVEQLKMVERKLENILENPDLDLK